MLHQNPASKDRVGGGYMFSRNYHSGTTDAVIAFAHRAGEKTLNIKI